MSKRRKKCFSYSTGERGRNRVRVYRHGANDKLYIEYRENGKRGRSLPLDTNDEEEAKRKADELSAELGRIAERERTPTLLTLRALIDKHGVERTPLKGASKQEHDRRAALMFVAFFEAQPEPERRCQRDPASLDRIDWERFIHGRRVGSIPGSSRRVRDRQIQYDLQFMVAILNWAVGAKFIPTNPWGGELRRAQGWGAMPAEKNPRRPSLTDELMEMLIAHGPANWQFEAALRLGKATGVRNSELRQQRWCNVDLGQGVIRWPEENDKTGTDRVVPLTGEAAMILRGLPSRGIGNALVFPAVGNPSDPTPRNTFQLWLGRAKTKLLKATPIEERERLKERLRGLGYHGGKRSAVRSEEVRRLPPKIQEAYFGTSYKTLTSVYDEVGEDDVRAAMMKAGMAPARSDSDPNGEGERRKTEVRR